MHLGWRVRVSGATHQYTARHLCYAVCGCGCVLRPTRWMRADGQIFWARGRPKSCGRNPFSLPNAYIMWLYAGSGHVTFHVIINCCLPAAHRWYTYRVWLIRVFDVLVVTLSTWPLKLDRIHSGGMERVRAARPRQEATAKNIKLLLVLLFELWGLLFSMLIPYRFVITGFFFTLGLDIYAVVMIFKRGIMGQ